MADEENLEPDLVDGAAKNLMKACFGDSDSDEEEEIVDDVVNLSESEDERDEEPSSPPRDFSSDEGSDDDIDDIREDLPRVKPRPRGSGKKLGGEPKKRERKAPEKRKKKEKPEGEKKKRAPKLPDEMEIIRAKGFLPEKRKRKKLTPEETQDITSKMARNLLDLMDSAATADEESLREGRVAIKKLEVKDQVIQGLRKMNLWDDLLSMNLLEQMFRWLKPSRSGDLPDINIRTDFLEILYDLPATTEQLRSSKIGTIVRLMYQAPQETHKNRMMASSIISKWTSKVLQINTSYRGGGESFEEEEESAPIRKKPRMSMSEEKDPEKAWLRRQQNSDKAIYVRVRAEVSDLNFSKRPSQRFEHPETTARPSEKKIRTLIERQKKI